VRLILRVCDPTSLRSVEDSISPSLNIERESIHADFSGRSTETPVVIFVEINVVQEDDDFRRGNERALKFDAHGGGVVEFAHVFTCEILHVGRWEDEHIIDGAMDKGAVTPCCDVTVNPVLGAIVGRRLDTDVCVLTYVESAQAMWETRGGNEWRRKLEHLLSINSWWVPRADGFSIEH
jgi:hypothetical protein